MKESEKQKYDRLLAITIRGIKKAAEAYDIHPQQVTKHQFFEVTEGITDWELRTIGGLLSIKKTHFPVSEEELASMRSTQVASNYVSKLQRDLADEIRFRQFVIKEIKEAIKTAKIPKVTIPTAPKKIPRKKNMIMELMLSDLHIGKKTKDFNIETARKRLINLASTFIQEYNDNKKIFNVERIILAMLGDIVESFTMHGLESASSCEFGNSKQIDYAVKYIFYYIMIPIAQLGLPVDFVGVTGNHDRTDTRKTYNNPGENNMTWAIYRGVEELCKVAGLKNIKFHIPKGSYYVLDIYKNHCLYEHGDNNKNNKAAYEAQMAKRSRQENVVIDFGRFGHWHEYQCYDRGRIIVNESLCGPDSFSMVLGYNSSPGQTINYYVETKNRPTCFYKSFPVYLG